MGYRQVYDLPKFASFTDDGRVLVVKLPGDTFVAIRVNAWGDDEYELEVMDCGLSTARLVGRGLITQEEADELYAAERERTKGSWRRSELNNLLRLIRKFPDEAVELLPLPTSFEQPLTAEEEAQKKRETELAELASLRKLTLKHPGFAKDFLAEATLLDTALEPDADLLEEYDNYPGTG